MKAGKFQRERLVACRGGGLGCARTVLFIYPLTSQADPQFSAVKRRISRYEQKSPGDSSEYPY
jgi:hypothetical protein